LTFLYKKFVPAVISFIIATVLLCLPASSLPKTNGNWFHDFQVDKLIHICIFGFLVFMFCRPIRIKGFLNELITKIYLFIAIAFCLYGILIEFIQKWFIPGRGFELFDIVADIIGCFTGFFIARTLLRRIKKPTKEELTNQVKAYARQFLQK
jgi:VanZ family protein